MEQHAPFTDVRITAVVSTGHMTEADNKFLDSNLGNPVDGIVAQDGGFRIDIHDVCSDGGKHEEGPGGHYRLFSEAGLSLALTGLVELAFEKGIDYLVLDQDGPVLDGVVTFNW